MFMKLLIIAILLIVVATLILIIRNRYAVAMSMVMYNALMWLSIFLSMLAVGIGVYLAYSYNNTEVKEEMVQREVSNISEDDEDFKYYNEYLSYVEYVLASSQNPELEKEIADTSKGKDSYRHKTLVQLLITNEGFTEEEAETKATEIEAKVDGEGGQLTSEE